MQDVSPFSKKDSCDSVSSSCQRFPFVVRFHLPLVYKHPIWHHKWASHGPGSKRDASRTACERSQTVHQLNVYRAGNAQKSLFISIFIRICTNFSKKDNAVANSRGAPVTGVPEAVRSAACPRKSSGSAWANSIKCANPCIKVTLQQRCKLWNTALRHGMRM